MTALAIDTETNGPYIQRGCKAFMVTACDDSGKLFKWSFDVDPYTREPVYHTLKAKRALADLYRVITNYETWVFHNALFDLQVLLTLPFQKPLTIDDLYNRALHIHDTMVMAHCHRSLDRMGLKGLAKQYIDYPEDDEKDLDKSVTVARRIGKRLGYYVAEPSHPTLSPLKSKKGKCDFFLPETLVRCHPEELTKEQYEWFKNVCTTYAMGDVERTMGLFIYFTEVLKSKKRWEAYRQNLKCVVPVLDMILQGFRVKIDNLPSIIGNLSNLKEQVRKSLQILIPPSSSLRRTKNFVFNPRSPKHLPVALFEDLKLDPIFFSDAGNPSTDKDVIKDFLSEETLTLVQENFLRRLLTFRKINSALSYLESYDRFISSKPGCEDWFLFPGMNVTGTSTLRLACRQPNTQNISKQKNDEDALDLTVSFNLREAFGPPKNKLWFAIDYQQLQLRIFAKVCGDVYLQQCFRDGMDIHDAVARRIFDTDNPSSNQRTAAKGVNFGIIFGAGPSRIERMTRIPGLFQDFKNQFPLVDRYIQQCERLAKKQRYVLTLGNYPLYVQRRTAYKGCNYVIQGVEGELVKQAIVYVADVCRRPAFPVKPIMTIHDEIIFETKEEIDIETFNSEHYDCIPTIAYWMNQAALDFTVETEVDCKVITDDWAHGTSYSFDPSLADKTPF